MERCQIHCVFAVAGGRSHSRPTLESSLSRVPEGRHLHRGAQNTFHLLLASYTQFPTSLVARLGLPPETAPRSSGPFPAHPPRVPPCRRPQATLAPARHHGSPRGLTVSPPSLTSPDTTGKGPGVSQDGRPGRQAQRAALGRSSPAARRGAAYSAWVNSKRVLTKRSRGSGHRDLR